MFLFVYTIQTMVQSKLRKIFHISDIHIRHGDEKQSRYTIRMYVCMHVCACACMLCIYVYMHVYMSAPTHPHSGFLRA